MSIHLRRILLCLIPVLLMAGIATAQSDPLPPAEFDSEAFLRQHFTLQDTYARVLCVAQNTPCPTEITTAVPALTADRIPPDQTYPISVTFDTIQDAANAAQPGDLIIIMPGRYRGIEYELTGGEDGAYIHFLGWGEPGSVIIDSPADPDKAYLRHHFYVIAGHHLIVQNIRFENASDGAGLFFSGYFNETGTFAHHILVMDVYSRNNGEWGLHSSATSYMLIQDSVFTGSAVEHGAYISGSGDHMLIRRNVFQGNNASGFQANPDPQTATIELFYYLMNTTGDTCGWTEDDVEFTGAATWHDLKACYDQHGLSTPYLEDGISEGLIIEQNVITANGAAGGAGINLAALRNSIVRNNLIYGNLAGGIACWDNAYAEEKGLPASDFGCQDVTIAHNTIVDEGGNRGAVLINQDARQISLLNNIVLRNRDDAVEIAARSGEGVQLGGNIITALTITDSPGVTDLGNVLHIMPADAAPAFVAPGYAPWVLEDGGWPTLNPARPDYHPLPQSLLVQGLAPLDNPPVNDVDGQFRTAPVAGAYVLATDAPPRDMTAPPAPAADTPGDDAPPPPAAPVGDVGSGGTITYTLPDLNVYRIAATPGAQPENVSAALAPLAISDGPDSALIVSPDGAWLSLQSERFDPDCVGWACLIVAPADLSSVEVVRADGLVIHPEGRGAISSGGTMVVYPAGDGPTALDLWMTQRAGDGWTTPLLLTGESTMAYHDIPTLSPDGTRVVFNCLPEAYEPEGTSICEVGVDGSGFRVILTPQDGPGDGYALHHPAYAPDGAFIFEGEWTGEQIWQLAPDGGEPVRITDTFNNDNSPCVLPDGRIASLWLNREGNDPGYHEIKVMTPDGSAHFMALENIDVLDIGLACGG
jgi:hypothetical protein